MALDVAAVDAGLQEQFGLADVQSLKPGELLRVLNGTPLGPVLDDRTLRRHRQEAGTRLGPDTRHVSLLAYFAWLFEQARDAPPVVGGTKNAAKTRYEEIKESARERNAAASAAGREVGELRPVVDPARKARCRRSVVRYAMTYERHKYPLKMSRDQIRSLWLIGRAIRKGGLYAVSAPRGDGKSTRACTAIRWAHLYGHRRFSMIVCANAPKAAERMEDIQGEFLENPLLAEDFPETVQAIQHLEGDNRRSGGQTFQGLRTGINWSNDEIVFANVPGSPSARSIIVSTGIESSSILGTNRRGMRPDFVLIDDPQDPESAASVATCEKRKRIINGSILGMAGPGKKITAVMACTPIRRGDVADEFLDRKLHPRWQGTRSRLLIKFPDDLKLWDRYKSIRDESQRKHGDGRLATAFYAKRRAAMDYGAEVAWEERYDRPDQISAVQFAMDKFYDDEVVFWSDFQCEPKGPDDAEMPVLETSLVERKVHAFKHGRAPDHAHTVVAHIDVQQDALYWTMMALGEGFNGGIVEYGAWPDPKRHYYSYATIKKERSYQNPRLGFQASLQAALNGDGTENDPGLLADLSRREFQRDDGAKFQLNLGLIDIGNWSVQILNVLRQSPFRGGWMGSRGDSGRRQGSMLMDWKLKADETRGEYWIRGTAKAGRFKLRQVKFDANYWKSQLVDRFRAPLGAPGCISLYERGQHRLIAEHLTSEYPKRDPLPEGGSRIAWHPLPGRENHFLDTTVGCLVAASVLGIKLKNVGHEEAFGLRTKRRRNSPRVYYPD